MKRLYNAVCSWLEADAEARGGEPMPQGDTFTQAETDGRHEPMYMHADHNRQSIDDDDSGAYRLGFNNDHRKERP